MPRISTEDRYLTVLNVFITDAAEKQDALLNEMRSIVDTADFPGWISSTVHGGQDKFGTANFIQWRSKADLELRYQGEKFQHATIPLFGELSTMKLLQTEVAYTGRAPGREYTEIGPHRDDYTVIEIYGVPQDEQHNLVDILGAGQDYLADTPGYRTHTVLRGVGSRFFGDRPFVVVYSQWDSKETYDAYRYQDEAGQPDSRLKVTAQLDRLANHYEWNTYRPVHTRSAGD
ncbi:antibiotic biosynthesis monooxygenase [Actinophytocola sp.]|uniref:antibiotic biosynthesis monooxygenase family protein n=1 Tax=Actinophytocola sp. TaxID=1872138 RepID=UPI002D7FB49A|nr:antibiotic biosynthesis monooxygenase [Actinophytocola sp.]HET9139219.1 antibiotic biosynthesis monooxygenase [Actinophytocola sp.]